MKQHWKKWVLILAALLLALFLGSHRLTVSRYTLRAQVAQPIRIVHLSDLHNAEFGKKNEKLIQLVKEQQPDLILLSGDMVNREEEDIEVVCDLIESLRETAPVYYGFGNHETEWEERWQRSLTEPLESAGARVVNTAYVDTVINETPLRIGGYMGYYRLPGMFRIDDGTKAAETAFAELFEDTERLKLLVNHIPTTWVDWGYLDKYPVDVVFSGHYHGGMIRIPLVERGLFAPNVGWLPRRTKGLYTGEKAACVLSAGLGSEYPVPRIHNPPECVVVELLPYA